MSFLGVDDCANLSRDGHGRSGGPLIGRGKPGEDQEGEEHETDDDHGCLLELVRQLAMLRRIETEHLIGLGNA